MPSGARASGWTTKSSVARCPIPPREPLVRRALPPVGAGGIGVTDEETVERIGDWRRTFNQPVGVWNTPDPQAQEALALVRQAGPAGRRDLDSNGRSAPSEHARADGARDFVLDSARSASRTRSQDLRAGARARRVWRLPRRSTSAISTRGRAGRQGLGMRAVLLDPGGHWGAATARGPDLLAAVRLSSPGAEPPKRAE